ncbi:MULTISPECIES: hypothetical protein [Streptomyces]|uniref:hypothetical protein n=1 Tax=Streptomyces TaxID=1883 RepID=UPI00135B7807|nr:hypothetical protein [Streptomyces sp. SLBN-134]
MPSRRTGRLSPDCQCRVGIHQLRTPSSDLLRERCLLFVSRHEGEGGTRGVVERDR